MVREQPPRQEGNPTNTRFVPATKLPSLDAVGGCREGGRLPNRFNLSWAQLTEPGPLKDEKDMETTGGSQWSSPPPARLPTSGAAAWTPQDWPGQRARTIRLLLFVVFWGRPGTWLRRVGESNSQTLGVENKGRLGAGGWMAGSMLPRTGMLVFGEQRGVHLSWEGLWFRGPDRRPGRVPNWKVPRETSP